MNRSLRVLACACTLGAASSLAHADGIGTSVTGVLTLSQVGSNPGANYFDPASLNNPSAPPTAPGDAPGIVPPAAGNAAGPTVTIGPGVEFESDILSPPLVFSADFTGSTLSIFTEALGYLTPFEIDFTDTAFTSFTQLTSSVQTVTNPTDPTAFHPPPSLGHPQGLLSRRVLPGNDRDHHLLLQPARGRNPRALHLGSPRHRSRRMAKLVRRRGLSSIR